MIDSEKIQKAVLMFLEAIGEDPNRPGLRDTPGRVDRMCREIFSGMDEDPSETLKVLEDEDHNEIVLVKDIPFYSVCEHHLLPFLGRAHVAYIPNGQLTGISKLARIVHVYARRLQVQERLGTLIAESIMNSLKPRGVMVVIEAEHLCMTMRGVRAPGAMTVTSVVRGIFLENAATRAETMGLICPAITK